MSRQKMPTWRVQNCSSVSYTSKYSNKTQTSTNQNIQFPSFIHKVPTNNTTLNDHNY